MEKYANLVLFGLVALTALVTVIITLRLRHRKQRDQFPELGEVTDILSLENNNAEDEWVFSEVRVRDNAGKHSPPQHSNRALSDLGFDNIGSMFTDTPEVSTEKEEKQFREEKVTEIQQDKDSNLIVVHVMAQLGQQFMGYDLLQALLAAGLRYGEMSIFHRYQDEDRGGKIIFSLASATEPGMFDMNKMGVFSCQGLSLFMQLQYPYHNLAALELFIMTVQQLAEDLDGHLQDAKRRELTEEIITSYRAKVRRFQNTVAQK